MDVLPVLHFVFIACRFYEKASPTFGINDGETQDANLEVGLGDRKGCLLPLVD